MWDVGLTGGAEVATLPAAAFFMPDAVFTGDGRHLLVTGAGGTIGVWDAHTWEQVGELGGPATPTPPSGIPGVSVAAPGDFRRIVPSPDASMTVASTFLEGPAYLWDIAAGGSPRELTVGSRVIDADWTPDSNVLALAGGDRGRGLVRIVDRSGRTITQLAFPGASVGSARFNRDGERLIVDLEPPGGYDPSDPFDPTAGRVEVWDWRDGEIVTTIDVLPWVAVPSPTSDLVAISPHIQARDQSLKIWNTVTGQPVATLAGHTGAVHDIAFSADGTRLATAGGDGTIRIWDPESGAHLLTLDGHIGAIVSVAFNPAGTQLATAGMDGTVRVWALDLDQLVKIAEQRVTRGFTDDECVRYLQRQSCR